MAGKLPEIGQRVKIRITGEGQPWYSTRIEDRDEQKITISAPFYRGAVVPIGVGTVVEVGYEQPDAQYSFTSTVDARRVTNTNNLRLYDLSIPAEVVRFQRREMFRLVLVLQVHFSVSSLPTQDNEALVGQVRPGCVLDLSGGGVKLATDLEVPVGSMVKLTFNDDSLNLTVKGQIVNSHKRESEDRTEYKYRYGVKFIELDRRTQEKIISFIFEEQRRRRRRELAVQ